MFAPDHRRTADEMRRVCRPDGRIAVACWTPVGNIGGMFKAIAAVGPPPPPEVQSPLLWGTEDHVRELLGDDVEFERAEVEWTAPSPEWYAEFMLSSFGPLINARELLGEAVQEAMHAWAKGVNEEGDGSFRYRGEYLLSVAG